VNELLDPQLAADPRVSTGPTGAHHVTAVDGVWLVHPAPDGGWVAAAEHTGPVSHDDVTTLVRSILGESS
jgi:hypothetical protein